MFPFLSINCEVLGSLLRILTKSVMHSLQVKCSFPLLHIIPFSATSYSSQQIWQVKMLSDSVQQYLDIDDVSTVGLYDRTACFIAKLSVSLSYKK